MRWRQLNFSFLNKLRMVSLFSDHWNSPTYFLVNLHIWNYFKPICLINLFEEPSHIIFPLCTFVTEKNISADLFLPNISETMPATKVPTANPERKILKNSKIWHFSLHVKAWRFALRGTRQCHRLTRLYCVFCQYNTHMKHLLGKLN